MVKDDISKVEKVKLIKRIFLEILWLFGKWRFGKFFKKLKYFFLRYVMKSKYLYLWV